MNRSSHEEGPTGLAALRRPDGHIVPPDVAARMITAVAAVAALAVTYLLAVQTEVGQVIDTSIMLAVASSTRDAHWPSAVLTAISPWTAVIATALLIFLACKGGGIRVAAATAMTAVGTILLSTVLKGILVRPALLDGYANSLPSGHTAAVAGIAAGATLASRAPWRFVVAFLGLLAVSVTGAATLSLEWHRPSDVLASVLIAIAVGLASFAFLGRR